jgi:hypothetical protein
MFATRTRRMQLQMHAYKRTDHDREDQLERCRHRCSQLHCSCLQTCIYGESGHSSRYDFDGCDFLRSRFGCLSDTIAYSHLVCACCTHPSAAAFATSSEVDERSCCRAPGVEFGATPPCVRAHAHAWDALATVSSIVMSQSPLT